MKSLRNAVGKIHSGDWLGCQEEMREKFNPRRRRSDIGKKHKKRRLNDT